MVRKEEELRHFHCKILLECKESERAARYVSILCVLTSLKHRRNERALTLFYYFPYKLCVCECVWCRNCEERKAAEGLGSMLCFKHMNNSAEAPLCAGSLFKSAHTDKNAHLSCQPAAAPTADNSSSGKIKPINLRRFNGESKFYCLCLPC
jgi:hypothetical protein